MCPRGGYLIITRFPGAAEPSSQLLLHSCHIAACGNWSRKQYTSRKDNKQKKERHTENMGSGPSSAAQGDRQQVA